MLGNRDARALSVLWLSSRKRYYFSCSAYKEIVLIRPNQGSNFLPDSKTNLVHLCTACIAYETLYSEVTMVCAPITPTMLDSILIQTKINIPDHKLRCSILIRRREPRIQTRPMLREREHRRPQSRNQR